ncbi:hypothetical protein [Escherichia coli]|uniref:hypothetical protein n=1 Tax=Escherichia coli TaxID=562 RepID=UPI0010589CD8|nr:hypothetical protein [Escherichia coli]HAH2770899.1 hypothetical protein [Escherichia coli]HAM4607110.1 hypothetical protein [Escherichia coli]
MNNITKIIKVFSLFTSIYSIELLAAGCDLPQIYCGAKSETLNTSDRNIQFMDRPNDWIDVGRIYPAEYDSKVITTKEQCNNSPMCAWSAKNLAYKQKPVLSANIEFNQQKVMLKGDDGKDYPFELSLTFDQCPIITFNSRNDNSGNVNAISAGAVGSYCINHPGAGNVNWQYNLPHIDGWCGNLVGCTYYTLFHFTSNKARLWIKPPSNLKPQTYYFNDIQLIKINVTTNGTVSEDAYLRISGAIKLPQRCFSQLSTNLLSFGDIVAGEKNGSIHNGQIKLNTNCYFPPPNLKHYVKVEGTSGGKLSNDSYTYFVNGAQDINNNSTLGFVFSLNRMPDCSFKSNNNTFNQEHLIRTINSNNLVEFSDNINISLCKYGVPNNYGHKESVVKITTRWEYN